MPQKTGAMSGFQAVLALAQFASLDYLSLSAPLRTGAILGYFRHIYTRIHFLRTCLLVLFGGARVLVAYDLGWLFFAFTDICHKFQPLKNYA